MWFNSWRRQRSSQRTAGLALRGLNKAAFAFCTQTDGETDRLLDNPPGVPESFSLAGLTAVKALRLV